MKRRVLVLSSVLVLLPAFALPAVVQTPTDIREERSEHPRIVKAIDASRRAIQELRAAIAFKAQQEDRDEGRRRVSVHSPHGC